MNQSNTKCLQMSANPSPVPSMHSLPSSLRDATAHPVRCGHLRDASVTHRNAINNTHTCRGDQVHCQCSVNTQIDCVHTLSELLHPSDIQMCLGYYIQHKIHTVLYCHRHVLVTLNISVFALWASGRPDLSKCGQWETQLGSQPTRQPAKRASQPTNLPPKQGDMFICTLSLSFLPSPLSISRNLIFILSHIQLSVVESVTRLQAYMWCIHST